MSTDYKDSITNLNTSIHDDVTGARTRLRGTVELLEHGQDTAAVTGLRAEEQRLDR